VLPCRASNNSNKENYHVNLCNSLKIKFGEFPINVATLALLVLQILTSPPCMQRDQ